MSFSGIPARIVADIGQTGGIALESTLQGVVTSLQEFQFVGSRLLVDASGTTIPISAASLPLPMGAATSANQGTEIVTLTSIDSKLPASLGPKTMAGSLSIAFASDMPPLQADISFGTVSIGNSTISALGAGATFDGAWEDVSGFAVIAFSLFSDQSSAPSGLSTQWSSDGSNADVIDQSDVVGGSGRAFSLSIRSRYFRIVYTNGAAPQGGFRLSTVYHRSGTGLISRPMTQGLTDNNYAQTVRSVLNAKLPSGNYKAVSMGQTVMADAVSVVLPSDQGSIPVSANQAGAWNIQNVTGTVSLPTGAATSADQTTANASLASIDGKLNSLGQKTMANSAPTVIASDQSDLPVRVKDGAGNAIDSTLFQGQQKLAVMTTDSFAYLTSQGAVFTVVADNFNLASGATDNPAIYINNPNGSGKTLHVIVSSVGIITANRSVVFSIFENPTVAVNGTAENIANNLAGSVTASIASAFTGPTTIANGSKVRALAVAQNTTPPIDSINGLIQVPPNNSLLITGKPTANNTLSEIAVTWCEV